MKISDIIRVRFSIISGYMDCVGGEDERNCEQCKNGAFLCASEKRCIASMKHCDGHVDCKDESDEAECTCEGRL